MLPKGPYQPQLTEKEILKFWLENKFYTPEFKSERKLSTTNNSERQNFTIVLPPPNANGNLHLGHMSGYAYQDLMARFNRMRGKRVLLLPGKDHAGIQTEVVFERELEKQGTSKREIGREEFFRQCYKFCMDNSKYAREQEQKIGLSADFDRELFTLDPRIVTEVLKAFELMYEDGLVYRDKRIINWCPRCQSALADIDTEFKDSQSPFYYFKYAFTEPEDLALKLKKEFEGKIITWKYERNFTRDGKEKLPFSYGTHKDIEIIGIGYNEEHKGEFSGRVIGIQMRLDKKFRLVVANHDTDINLTQVLEKIFLFEIKYYAGAHIILFDEYPEDRYYTNGFILGTVRPETKFGDTALAVDPDDERYKEYVGREFEVKTLLGLSKIKVISDNAVDESFGTGMVKVTPAHSPEDWEIAKRHPKEAFPEKQVIDFDGKMNHLAGRYEGLTVKEARKEMLADMNSNGMLIYLDENYSNRIRICERCKHPIEPLVSYQWFVDTRPLKDEAKRLVEDGSTEIMPEGKKKTFFQWMNQDEDWCITRQLWWGYRLPVWYKGKRDQYISPTGEVKERIGGKIIETIEDYKDIIYVGRENPNSPDIFLIPGKYGFMHKKIYPEIKAKYSKAVQIFVNHIALPSYQDYKEEFDKLNFEDQVIVAHSLGTKAILKYIIEKDVQVKTLVLIAAVPKIREKDVDAPYADLFDPIDYKRLENLVGRLIFLYSDNDDLINLIDFDEVYKSKLPHAEFYLESGLGHYASSEYDYSSPKLEEILSEACPLNPIPLTVVRHGETDYNASGRFHGITDTELNENGRSQARTVSKKLERVYDVIITSPLKRAKETAEILNAELKIDLQQNDLLKERDFGNLEGLTWEEFQLKFPQEAALNTANYQANLNKGETIAQVESRVDEFLEWLTKSGYKRPLIVTHAAIIRILERKLKNLSDEESRKKDPENLEVRTYKMTGEKWHQDEDVLDTWFSSGQWPFLTLMAKEGDYSQFYPTNVMETGWDILLFWVTRMMLLNPYRAKGLSPDSSDDRIIPFKDVYLHGLVLDKNGVKMSKSKGNGIDPFEMMQKYGTDALRFSFIKGNSVGQNYRLFEEKIAANRNFSNKIWNVTKFVLSNIEDNAEDLLTLNRDVLKFTQEDLAFLTDLENLTKDTTRRILGFQFGVASEELYESFWHKFADIYLEQIKTRLYTKDREGNPINTSTIEQEGRLAAQWVLYHSLETYLKLLHPFIPFITEKAWLELPKCEGESETIMYSQWPN